MNEAQDMLLLTRVQGHMKQAEGLVNRGRRLVEQGYFEAATGLFRQAGGLLRQARGEAIHVGDDAARDRLIEMLDGLYERIWKPLDLEERRVQAAWGEYASLPMQGPFGQLSGLGFIGALMPSWLWIGLGFMAGWWVCKRVAR